MAIQGQRMGFHRDHSPAAADLHALIQEEAHTLPYLPTGSPSAAEDVFQLEADPKCRVRHHLTEVDAAPQHQGLTCTPAPGWRGTAGSA